MFFANRWATVTASPRIVLDSAEDGSHFSNMKNKFLYPVLALIFCVYGTVLHAQDGEIAPPEKQLAKWYGEHLKGKGPILDESKHQFWSFIFGEELQKFLKKGELEFDPFFFAQDTEIKDLAFKRIEIGERPNALVLITFKNFGKPIELIAAMDLTDHGWRLINIVKPDDGQSLVE